MKFIYNRRLVDIGFLLQIVHLRLDPRFVKEFVSFLGKTVGHHFGSQPRRIRRL